MSLNTNIGEFFRQLDQRNFPSVVAMLQYLASNGPTAEVRSLSTQRINGQITIDQFYDQLFTYSGVFDHDQVVNNAGFIFALELTLLMRCVLHPEIVAYVGTFLVNAFTLAYNGNNTINVNLNDNGQLNVNIGQGAGLTVNPLYTYLRSRFPPSAIQQAIVNFDATQIATFLNFMMAQNVVSFSTIQLPTLLQITSITSAQALTMCGLANINLPINQQLSREQRVNIFSVLFDAIRDDLDQRGETLYYNAGTRQFQSSTVSLGLPLVGFDPDTFVAEAIDMSYDFNANGTPDEKQVASFILTERIIYQLMDEELVENATNLRASLDSLNNRYIVQGNLTNMLNDLTAAYTTVTVGNEGSNVIDIKIPTVLATNASYVNELRTVIGGGSVGVPIPGTDQRIYLVAGLVNLNLSSTVAASIIANNQYIYGSYINQLYADLNNTPGTGQQRFLNLINSLGFGDPRRATYQYVYNQFYPSGGNGGSTPTQQQVISNFQQLGYTTTIGNQIYSLITSTPGFVPAWYYTMLGAFSQNPTNRLGALQQLINQSSGNERTFYQIAYNILAGNTSGTISISQIQSDLIALGYNVSYATATQIYNEIIRTNSTLWYQQLITALRNVSPQQRQQRFQQLLNSGDVNARNFYNFVYGLLYGIVPPGNNGDASDPALLSNIMTLLGIPDSELQSHERSAILASDVGSNVIPQINADLTNIENDGNPYDDNVDNIQQRNYIRANVSTHPVYAALTNVINRYEGTTGGGGYNPNVYDDTNNSARLNRIAELLQIVIPSATQQQILQLSRNLNYLQMIVSSLETRSSLYDRRRYIWDQLNGSTQIFIPELRAIYQYLWERIEAYGGLGMIGPSPGVPGPIATPQQMLQNLFIRLDIDDVTQNEINLILSQDPSGQQIRNLYINIDQADNTGLDVGELRDLIQSYATEGNPIAIQIQQELLEDEFQ